MNRFDSVHVRSAGVTLALHACAISLAKRLEDVSAPFHLLERI